MSCKPWVVSYTDVIDGLTFQACCPACGWEGQATELGNALHPALRVRRCTRCGGPLGVGPAREHIHADGRD